MGVSGYLPRKRRISSLIAPACTGLPPGLLILSTTPCVPLFLNAACNPEITLSALARPLASISPWISTIAVHLSRQSRSPPVHTPSPARRTKRKIPSATSLKNIPQRRARRCSRKPSVASRSRTRRSPLSSIISPAPSLLETKNAAVTLADFYRRETCTETRAGDAQSVVGLVQRAMGSAHQV